MLYYTTISHFVITDDTAPNGDGTSVIMINNAFMYNIYITHAGDHNNMTPCSAMAWYQYKNKGIK